MELNAGVNKPFGKGQVTHRIETTVIKKLQTMSNTHRMMSKMNG